MIFGAGLAAAGLQVAGQWYANRRQEKFANQMSNTAWQRRVKDLRAAGMNPALAYGQGGASTPTIQPGNIGAGAASAIQLRNQSKLADADSNQKESMASLQSQQESYWLQKTKESEVAVKQAKQEFNLFRETYNERLKTVGAELAAKRAQAGLWSAYSETEPFKRRLMGAQTGVSSEKATQEAFWADLYEGTRRFGERFSDDWMEYLPGALIGTFGLGAGGRLLRKARPILKSMRQKRKMKKIEKNYGRIAD